MNYFYTSHRNQFSLRNSLRLRKRYVFTRANRLRLRYSAGALSSLLVLTLIVGGQIKGFGGLSHSGVVSNVTAENSESNSENGQIFLSESLRARISDSMRSAPLALKKAEEKENVPLRHVSVGAGQTIAGVLQSNGVSGTDAFYAVKAIKEHFDPRKVRAGQKLDVHFVENEAGEMAFEKLSMKISPIKKIFVTKQADEDFSTVLEKEKLERKVYGRVAKIQTSLYGSAARADIPSQITAELIRIYSWNVDFQRDVRRGDKVEVLYEAFENKEGDYAQYGKILYANIKKDGRAKPIYRYEMANGRVDYFGPDGTSIRKTLMKTPVDGARISSGYGYRRHPVLGYNKLHKGMDFAAPTGTPIYAAGDGVVEYASRKGSYGNYIRIRHNSKLKTAYAHLHKFKKGMRSGKTVKQGDVIGYVGSTGRSTGPHLHYEVLVNGVQVNPRSVKLPTGETLNGSDLQKFKAVVRDTDERYASLTKGLKFAMNELFRNDDAL